MGKAGGWQRYFYFALQSFLLIGIIVFTGVVTRQIMAVPPTAGLVGYWNLDEASGAVANDSSGNGNHGALVNSPVRASGASCKFGGCLQFTSGSRRVDIPYSASINTTTGFTVAFWYRATSNSGSIAAKPFGTGTLNTWQLEFTGSSLSFTSSGGSTQNFDSIAAPATGAWHFVTASWDGTSKKLYLNGTLRVTVARSISFDTRGLVIGGDYNSGSFVLPFLGFVDDVRLYNRALTAAEVTELYTSVPDATPPVISGVTSSGITSSAATITWTTNEAATTQVEYGTTTAYGSLTTLNSTLVTAHTQTLAGLTGSTLYHYRVRSRDAAGNEAISPDFILTTAAPPDTTPPVISGVTSSGITSSAATITWNTNETSTTQVEYGTTTAYGSLTSLDATLVTAHTQTLTGLTASTLYHYRARSRDAAGNEAVSPDFTFTTAVPPDTTPPVISGVTSSGITFSGATISWMTDEAATTQIEYGLTTAYGSLTTLDATLVTAHTQTLTGLTASTLYHYRVRSRDAAGNEAVSDDFTLTTAPPDTTPPVITGVTSGGITASNATISWVTDEAATTQVEYGTTTAYGSLTTLDSTLVMAHTQTLTGLAASTLYHYRVRSRDGSGNEAVSDDFTLMTAAPPDTTPPVISGVTSGDITLSGATISWTTDEAATTQVEYGTTTAYGSLTTLDASLVTAHNQTLAGLSAGTLYHYRVRSRDAAGNEAISPGFTFTTATPPDTTPPVISGVTSSGITASDATISWTTDEAATTQIEYGLTTAYGSLTTLDAALVTAHSQAITGLTASTLYHYQVRSRDTAGNEAVSADFTLTTAAPPDTTPPVISGVTSNGITASAATISWTTDEAATTQVEYGTTTAYGNLTTLDATLVMAHTQTLTGLIASTLYHYRVRSRDAAGNEAVSDDFTLTTAPPDTTPPVISGVTSSGITSNGATINWATDEAASTQVEYGTTTAYGSLTTLNAALVTAHSQAITDLTASTLYHYRVRSRDEAGNEAISPDFTLTTAAPPDTTPPVISGVTSNGITASGATISWTTDEAATTQVEYGTATAYGSLTTLDATLVTAHSQALTGLSASTLYHYRVRSRDGAGNEAISPDFTLTTAAPPDTTPPVISGVTSSGITASGATISWTTNEAATTQVEYGTTTAYGSLTTFDASLVTAHSQPLTGLTASTLYHYRVRSRDAAGNEAVSADFTLTTAAPPDTTPPVISGVTSSGITASSATISWTTDEAATTQVEYGLTTAYGSLTTLNASLMTAHSQILSGLTANTLYHYRVKSRDAAGNEAVSSDFTLTTAPDTTPPVISGVTSSGITSSAATISWTTNEAATTQVEYGTTTAYGSLTAVDPSLVTAHSQTIAGLSASTLYHYRVRSRDAAGNEAFSADFTLTTTTPPDTTPPIISSVVTGSVNNSSATIIWSTNEAATTQIEYGLTTAYGALTSINADAILVTGHRQTITGLTANTLYHYRVRSRDAAGNEAVSADFTFTTLASAAGSFQTSTFVSNVIAPTAIEFASDGRLFICEKGGSLRVVKNGQLLSAPFVTVDVDTGGERGLLGITFAPDFAVNRYVYLYYTARTPTPHNRLSRFTANGDIAVPGSELILFDLPAKGNLFHQGGAIHFGADGKLYVAVGNHEDTASAQSFTDPFGKILRLNPDGTIPADNPFYGQTTGIQRAIWAYGLRNPFTFAVDSGTGRIFVNDVGNATWEEVNQLARGANYGWPTCEGPQNTGLGTCNNPAFTYPLHAYSHPVGTAIVGGTFYRASQFPSQYFGAYFFGDYSADWIKYLDPANQVPGINNPATSFNNALSSVVDLKVGPDGALYAPSIAQNNVRKIEFITTGNRAPTAVASATPSFGAASLTVSFNASASSDPDLDPLSYSWNFGDGTSAGSGVTVSHTYSTPGPYNATLTVNDGRGGVDSVVVQISVGAAPQGTIITPASGAFYNAGDTISYSGSGTDAEDGVLAASRFSWTVVFHHDDHTHPFLGPINGVTSGSFQIPQTGESSANTWYRIHLTVTDSTGLTHTSSRYISPNTLSVTLNTNFPGLSLTLDGQPANAPINFTGVAGFIRSIGAPSPQTVNGRQYEFVSWSDGGAQTHNITTPGVNTTYTAEFRELPDTIPPAISGVTSSGITMSDATISWATDEAATTQVEYGLTTAYGSLTTLDSTLVTAHTRTWTGLAASTLYHYRVRSRDAAGNEATSADFTFTTAAPPDTTPPVISGVTSSGITASGATISWTTDEAATTQVEYGLTTGYGSQTTLNAALVTAHAQTLSGLSANTLYHYRVKSRDAAGNEAVSPDFTLTTAPPDTTPPVISGVTSSAITASNATISWMTDEAATTQVEYGLTTAYGNLTTLNPTLLTAHTQTLTGLTASTLYHYRVRSRDAAGNEAISADFSFTTAAPPDTTPPVVSGVTSSAITTSGATISWTTNEASTTQVEYGLTTAYGSLTTLNAALVTAHTQALTGLTASTLYHYRVRSRDAAGNEAVSADFTFTTAAPTQPAGLVGHWKLDETTGATATDSSGNGNHGTLVNSPVRATGASCKFGGCLQFTSGSRRVDIPYSASINTTTGFTVAFWYRATTNSGSIAAKPFGTGTLNTWQLEFAGSGLSFTSSGGSSQNFDSIAAPATGAWHFVVATWSGTSKKLYLNGTLRVTATRSISFDTRGLVVGGDYNSGSFALPFLGFVDEVRLYNRALTDSEVTQLFNQ